MTPKTNTIYLWKHQDTQNNSRKSKIIVENRILGNINIWEIEHFENVERRGPTNIEVLSNIFGKYWVWEQHLSKNMKWIVKGHWIWDQYLFKNMKWKFGNMRSIFIQKMELTCLLNIGPISIKNTKCVLKLLNEETKTRRNQETAKPTKQ